MTVKYWPAMFSMPVRVVVLVLAAADHVTLPLPVPLAGVHVSQASLLDGVQAHPAPAVTLSVPLAPVAAAEALAGETV